MLLAYFGLGFAGATLVGTSSPCQMIAGLTLGGDFDYALGSNSISGIAAIRSAALAGTGNLGHGQTHGILPPYTDNETSGRNAILIFTFVTLTSGLLYGEGTTSQHSALIPCVIIAVLSAVCACLYLSTNQIAYKRVRWSCRMCFCDNKEPVSATPLSERCWDLFLTILSFLPKEPKDRLTAADCPPPTPPQYEAVPLLEQEESFSESIPMPFITMCQGDTPKATRAFSATLRWRRENGVDTIMTTPQPDFQQIISLYPHAIHGISLDGCVVVYEVLGKAKPKELSAAGITPTRLVWHFILRNEYILRRLAAQLMPPPNPSSSNPPVDLPPPLFSSTPQKMMTVLDVEGISVADITVDVMSFVRQSGELMDLHYPGVVQRLVICNAPSWFYSTWTFLARVLPDSVRKKIIIIHDSAGLDKFIHPSQRPIQYRGTGIELGHGVDHKGLLDVVSAWGEEVSAVTQVAIKAGVGTAAPVKAVTIPDYSDSEEEQEFTYPPPPEPASPEPIPPPEPSTLFSWVRSRFSKPPSAAHLGAKNKFYYNETTGKWTLEASNDDWDEENQEEGRDVYSTPVKGRAGSDEVDYNQTPFRSRTKDGDRGHFGTSHSHSKMTPAQLEEHGLVLAIQAAHLAATFGRFGDRARGNDHPLSSLPLARSMDYEEGQTWLRTEPPIHPTSKRIVTLVSCMYLLSCFMQTGLMAMLPVWLVVPAVHGGEGFSVKDLSLVLSAAGLAALHAHIFIKSRISRVAQASPVRAMRTGAGSLVLACFVMPAMRGLIWLPSESLLAVPLPAVLIVWAGKIFAIDSCPYILTNFSPIVWSATLTRQAAGCLLSVASPSHTLSQSLSALGDTLGPLFSALLLGWTLGYTLPYPMDAAFLFSSTACIAWLIYMGSLVLHLQFKGDFGTMPDEASIGDSARRKVAEGGLGYVVGILVEDMSLLLGPLRGSVYGTRLFNLKSSGVKDV